MHNNSKVLSISSPMVILLFVVTAVFPIFGLFLSVMFFRQRFAPILFIYFSFYFGWFYEPQMDLLMHYKHFKHIVGESLYEQWTDSRTIRLGKEVYPVLFKYFIGLISDSKHLFSACACMVYTSLFVFGVLKPLRPLYLNKMSFPSWILFLGVVFTVEYYWFLGFRFWSGVFFFFGFYLRYINSGKKKYLFLSLLCTCFHFSLLPLWFVAIINHFLRYRPIIHWTILFVSFVIRFIGVGWIWSVAKFGIFSNFVKESFHDDKAIKSISSLATSYREEGNQFYLLREYFIFFGAIAAVFILYRKTGNGFILKYSKLWSFCILLFALANFGYVSLTFYDRFFKIAVLLSYIFSYMWMMNVQYKLSFQTKINIAILAFLPVLYSIVSQVVEQRNTLFQLKLWFSTWFFQ